MLFRSTVVIGRYQNPWSECDVQKMEEDNIILARRQSGGGAVFHDLNNTNFTFLSGINEYSKERNNGIITKALESFGVNAYASGRNDILVDEKKISGSAFKLKKDRAFHHGTLLINTDMKRLARYLTPSPKKLQAKGVSSVQTRVANLADYNPVINHESICQAIIKSFSDYYGIETAPEILDHSRLSSIPGLINYFNLMKDWDWRFGKTPEFSHRMDEKLTWAWVELYLDVQEGIISEAKLYSDALISDLILEINKILVGCRYKKEELSLSFESLTKTLPEYKSEIKEFSEWLLKNI